MQYVGSDLKTVNTAEAARLMNVTERWVRASVTDGKLAAVSAPSLLGGGRDGTAYRIPVDALPAAAQIAYWQQSAVAELGHGGQEFDLVGYHARHGEDGLAELRRRQRAALAAHGLRRDYEERGRRGYTEALESLAGELDVPQMTLWRWERDYAASGLAGLARKGRADAGQSRSACLLARDYLEYLMESEHKLTPGVCAGKAAAAGQGPGRDRLQPVPLPARIGGAQPGDRQRAPASSMRSGRLRAGLP